MRELAREGVACVYITHRLDEVREIADRITVLRDGRSVAAFPTGAVPRASLIRAMAGRPVSESLPGARASGAARARHCWRSRRSRSLRLAGQTLGSRDISFEVRAGEVVGLAGLMGSGRTELLMHLYGAWGARRGGAVRLLGEAHDDASPARSLERGLALLSEDRRRFGLIPDRSVEFNLTLSSLARLTRHGLLEPAEEHRLYRRMASVAAGPSGRPGGPIRGLSGGNQQKVLLGRVLLTEPRVILLDEPTRGVDVATKFEIYELINRLTLRARRVLLVSSELPELLGLSDRMLVCGRADRHASCPPGRSIRSGCWPRAGARGSSMRRIGDQSGALHQER